MTDIKAILDRFGELKSERSTWNQQYQVVGEYISQNKQNFETTHTAGEFLNDETFDSTGTFAAHNAASALLGMLWPASAKQSIEIVPPDDIELNAELQEFYAERMTKRGARAMDDPKANLSLSLDEYMLDQMIFGTSGVGVEAGRETKLLYAPYGVKEVYIEEGAGGRVASIWLSFEWTVNRAIDEYGVDAVSDSLRKKYEDGNRSEKVSIIHVMRPRMEAKAEAGVLAMPIESLHIEAETKHMLKEEVFNELPIAIGRFRKLNYEKYGRSPAMMALPDVREANALREAVIVATEKVLDMPKGVFNDGVLGGGIIDTSAKAINVFNDSGSGSPIFDIGTPPDINAALARLEELKNNISQHFHIDRLLDFNNQQQMTFGEAQIRNQIRTASLSGLFARQIGELFTPLIERSINILFRAGEFGVVAGSDEEQDLIDAGYEDIEYIPDVLVERLEKGESIYEVRYKTQAAQASRGEDYLSIIDVVQFATQAMQIDPELQFRVNLHEAVKEIADIRSVPAGIIRADEEVAELKEAMMQAQQQQQEMDQLQQGAQIAKDVAPLIEGQ